MVELAHRYCSGNRIIKVDGQLVEEALSAELAEMLVSPCFGGHPMKLAKLAEKMA